MAGAAGFDAREVRHRKCLLSHAVNLIRPDRPTSRCEIDSFLFFFIVSSIQVAAFSVAFV